MKINKLYINLRNGSIILVLNILKNREIFEIKNKSYFKIAEYKDFSSNFEIDLTHFNQEKYQSIYSVYIYSIGEKMKYRLFRDGKNIFFQIITREKMGKIMTIKDKQYKKLRDLILNKKFLYFSKHKQFEEYNVSDKIFSKDDLLKMFIIKEMK